MKDKIVELFRSSASKYFFIGLSAFLADYIILLLTYYVLGFSISLAVTLGFLTGFVISFALNKNWVFKNVQRKRTERQIVEYSLLVIFNYIFTVFAVSILHEIGIMPELGKILTMSLIMCWNYLLFKWVIFSKAED